MSTNITAVEVLHVDNFRLPKKIWEEWCQKDDQGTLERAECSFLDLEPKYKEDEFYYFTNFAWSGIGSGNNFEHLIEYFLPHFKGEAHLVFIWEGGNMGEDGVRVKDGKVTFHDIVKALGPER